MNRSVKRWLSIFLIVGLCISVIPLAVFALSLTQLNYGPAPIRSMTRCQDGSIVGGRSSGHELEVWASTNNGASWSRRGTVAGNASIDYGDPMFLAVPGTNTVYCAFREKHNPGGYYITVCKSTDSGANWVYDSNLETNVSRFVGAPWLFIANNGDLQCYYDSEKLPADKGYAGSQWIVMKGRNGKTGAWTKYGTKEVSRDAVPSQFVRDGMCSVVDLGNNRIMCVTEGVERTPSGGALANVIRSIQSFDGGYTWDYNGRQIVYQSRIDPGSGKRFNAYAPVAIRVGNGPVGVIFCTDEDFSGPPDASDTPPDLRRTHIKYLQTTDTFEHWGGVSPIWTGGDKAYVPGMMERASNDILITIDHFAGNQRTIQMYP